MKRLWLDPAPAPHSFLPWPPCFGLLDLDLESSSRSFSHGRMGARSLFSLGLCTVGLRTGLVCRSRPLSPGWFWFPSEGAAHCLHLACSLVCLFSASSCHHSVLPAIPDPLVDEAKGSRLWECALAVDLILECLLTPGCRGIFSPKSGRESSQLRMLIVSFVQKSQIALMHLHEEAQRGCMCASSIPVLLQSRIWIRNGPWNGPKGESWSRLPSVMNEWVRQRSNFPCGRGAWWILPHKHRHPLTPLYNS